MARFLFSCIIPVLLLYLVLAGIWNAVLGRAPLGDVLRGTLVLSVIAAAIVAYRIFRLRRAYKRSAMAQHEAGLALAFNDKYFVSGLPGRSEGRFLWPVIYDFAENDRIALVYTSKRAVIVIPKHAMPPESWDALRSLTPKRKS